MSIETIEGNFDSLNRVELSIIVPVFNERENLAPLFQEIHAAMNEAGLSFEIIAINDGSTDGSDQILREIAKEDKRVKVINFRKNFGQTSALDAGFFHAKGAIFVTLDADGQNDPKDITRLVQPIREGVVEFVSGWRKERQDDFFQRTLPSRLANFIIRKVTKTKLHDLGCSLKAYKAEIIHDLRLYGEMHRYIGVLVENMGASVLELQVNHRPRVYGVSKYGFERVFKVLLDLFTVWFLKGFHTKPIYVFGGVSFALLLSGVGIEVFVLYEKIAQGSYVHRNPLFSLGLICSLLGLLFLGLGIITELLVRIYYESQGKAIYTVRDRINF